MGKKNGRNIYNIDEVKLEIDYDKLAEAIVEAQAKAKEKKTKLNLRSRAMRFFNCMTYSVVCVIAAYTIYVIWKDRFPTESISLYGCILLTVLLAFVGMYAFLCQQETFDDNGEDSISHFNTNMALIALIVALVALMKGVA